MHMHCATYVLKLHGYEVAFAAMQINNTAEWLQEDSTSNDMRMHAIHCIAIHYMDDGCTIQK
jgi:hypothetical protein